MDNLYEIDTNLLRTLPKVDKNTLTRSLGFYPAAPITVVDKESERRLQGIEQKRKEEEERDKRSLKLQCESNETQKLILFLIQCVNKDNEEIIQKLGGLINSIEFGNNVEECNLLLIQKELEYIKENSNNLQSDFISAAKQNLLDKGVDYTIIFILQALKTLFLTP
ncbi:hypothetical protein G9F73_012435 [Clostridium estertheticum]|uniref:hypothetical protein n=1 Tax=Clostridium estertheticum TaxID=238834 RepID=UPI0013EE4CB1|nr:hypothetical protein [Clostridium estertheticum]MBZ9608616.1 hypothetical protein [Clostridium estertheticum]